MTRRQELVSLDERFIVWLASSNSRTLLERFVVVSQNKDGETDLTSYGEVEEFKNHVKRATEFSGGWRPVALFDTVERREIKFEVRTTVIIL